MYRAPRPSGRRPQKRRTRGRGNALDAQVLARPSESSLDLINNEQQAVLVTDATETLEVALGSGDVSSLSEDGLNQDRGGVAGCGFLLQEELELCSEELGKEGWGKGGRRGGETHAVEGVLDEVVVRGRVRETELVPVGVGSGEDAGLYNTQKRE